MIQELIDKSIQKGYLIPEAYEYIKEFAKNIADKGKDYSDNEKEYCSYAIITDLVRFWIKYKNKTDDEINNLMQTLAVNSTLRGWQWFNQATINGDKEMIEK